MTHSANGPWDKGLNFNFPTKHVIPESLKFSHWLSEMKSSGWVSRGDWSHPSKHTLWDVKGPQQKHQLWLQGKTVLPPINLLETKLGGNKFRLRTKSEILLCWSWWICRLRYSTTHATNVDISSKFGPRASSTLPWAFLITLHLFLAQHFWDKSPWLVSRPVRPGCAREMELRCLSPKTTKWNEFFFVTANLISWRIQRATWWT